MASIYDFTLYDRKGNAYPLAAYKGPDDPLLVPMLDMR